MNESVPPLSLRVWLVLWPGSMHNSPGDASKYRTAIYHMLKDGTMYQDLGRNCFDQRSKETQKQRLIKRLAELGYAAEFTPLTA